MNSNRLLTNRTAYLLLFAIILVITYTFIRSPPEKEDNTKSILLVDNLYKVDDSFQSQIETICNESGVELYVHQDANVSYLMKLKGTYSLIILRLHSTCQYNVTWAFTSEEYNPNKYVIEQLAGEIHSARVNYQSDNLFVVSSYFILQHLPNNIESDCVILMGCNSFDISDMAKAWIRAGASYYVGWNGDVSLTDTDELTLMLVERYLEDGVILGIVDVLPSNDFTSGDSWLRVYPDE